MKQTVENYFGLLKIQVKFLKKLSLEVFDHLVCLHMISLLAILHCLIIKSKISLQNLLNTHLTERTHFIRLVMIKMPFCTSEQPERYKMWSCLKMFDALHYLLDNIFIRFRSKLYRQFCGYSNGY